MGIPVEYVHHEVAPSQHEIDLRYTDALTMADNVMTYRLTVKEVAQEFGIYATFMPKPVAGVNGSGMHTHQSLFEGDRNAFFDATDEYHLSKTAKSYIAGILRHAPEITLLTNQWVNSYKRLVPGLRGARVRLLGAAQPQRAGAGADVQARQGGAPRGSSTARPTRPATRTSRSPRCSRPGSPGIEDEYELPPEASNNIYEMTEDERGARRHRVAARGPAWRRSTSPSGSDVLREALGDHVHEYLIRNKREEWDAFKAYVTPVRAGALPPHPLRPNLTPISSRFIGGFRPFRPTASARNLH